MVRRKEAQASSLLIVIAAVILYCIHIPAAEVGLYPGAPFVHRLLYPFFHASWLHLAVNCWALLSIVFLYQISFPMMVSSFIIAASYPIGPLSFLYGGAIMPTVGLSGLCYALLGRYSFIFSDNRKSRLKYHAWFAVFIGIGFFFPQSNAWLHLYCYLCGFILAQLNRPIAL